MERRMNKPITFNETIHCPSCCIDHEYSCRNIQYIIMMQKVPRPPFKWAILHFYVTPLTTILHLGMSTISPPAITTNTGDGKAKKARVKMESTGAEGEKDKPFKCDLCPKRYARRDYLERHLLNRMPFIPSACSSFAPHPPDSLNLRLKTRRSDIKDKKRADE